DIANGTILAEDLNAMGAANDQVLKWNGTAWAPAADNVGATGTTELADGTTILGAGTAADRFRVAPGANGQFISTTGGVVTWSNLPTGTGGTVNADGITIEGNGSVANPLQVRDLGITTAKINTNAVTTAKLFDGAVTIDKILDDNVTPAKIEEGTNGQVLTTNAGGDVVWAAPAAGAVLTTAAIDGDGTTGNELDIADNAIDTDKII
ncbi:hypothetical protein, partial [uncultured Croceitalea sp.]|uniref:hypothetical protein n=1 Tax=uncultured Croceitalea sp. TaxID=1798908 RepID=UPI0033063330